MLQHSQPQYDDILDGAVLISTMVTSRNVRARIDSIKREALLKTLTEGKQKPAGRVDASSALQPLENVKPEEVKSSSDVGDGVLRLFAISPLQPLSSQNGTWPSSK